MTGLRCGIYSAIKKNKIMPFAATWMQSETLILSEVSQKEKDKYHMISHIWNLINGTNESFHRKENHEHREQTCGCQGGGGGNGMAWEFGGNRCKLWLLEWISNEVLLYSTGNLSSHLRHLRWSTREEDVVYIHDAIRLSHKKRTK